MTRTLWQRTWFRQHGTLIARLAWEPRDVWVGFFVHGARWGGDPSAIEVDVYVCVLPMLPLRLWVLWWVPGWLRPWLDWLFKRQSAKARRR